jgi:hypothetical protein
VPLHQSKEFLSISHIICILNGVIDEKKYKNKTTRENIPKIVLKHN